MGNIQQFIVGIAVSVGIIKHEFEFRLDLGRDQSAADKLAQMIREAAQLNAWYVGTPICGDPCGTARQGRDVQP